MSITDDELRKLIALGEKATARPWVRDREIDADFFAQADGKGVGVATAENYDYDAAYIVAAANLAPEIAAELIAAREEIQRLRVVLESLRITSHAECEDCWYSCPKSDDYCGTDDREHCACGMDKQNAIIDAALNGGDL